MSETESTTTEIHLAPVPAADPALLENFSPALEAAILRELMELAAQRAAAEERTQHQFQSGNKEADEEFQRSRSGAASRFESETQRAASDYAVTRRRVLQRFEQEHTPAQQEFVAAREKIARDFEDRRRSVQKAFDVANWEAHAVFEATKDQPARQLEEFTKLAQSLIQSIRGLHQDARSTLERWRQSRAAELAAPAPEVGHDPAPLATLQSALETAGEQRLALLKLKLPRLFQGSRLAWVFMALWLALISPLWWLAGGPHGLWIAWIGALVLCGALAAWLYPIARAKVERSWPALSETVARAEAIYARAIVDAKTLAERQEQEIAQRRQRDLDTAAEKFRIRTHEATAARDKATAEASETFPRRIAETTERRDRDLRDADEKNAQRVTEIRHEYESTEDQVQQHYRQRTDEIRLARETQWQALADAWLSGMARIHSLVGGLQQRSTRLFPDWKPLASENWTPPTTVPPAIRFGQFYVPMEQIPHGTTTDTGLAAVAPAGFTLPALLPFPTGCSLLLKTRGSAKTAAAECLQTLMLRLLTALPPGKVRFTIVDPVGLGENFAAFMHLSDYDEALISHRIWTDPRHIEQRLTDLSEHMENVIQKYLRNEFQTIEEYNTFAGEIAEPFRFLVIANFPVGFSEAAARRLLSIISSGPRCGVFTLISLDTKETLPAGFSVKELESRSTTLAWDGEQFAWKHDEFGQFPLSLDGPPAAEEVTRILHSVGRQTLQASKVEVPFEFIAPDIEDCWTSSTRHGIDVPLGRAGATRLQHLRLGHGTAQHALIAGQTGSGKSTLLHALITNVALRYRPEELELYLVDFKKGVEFKTYAAHQLPHARVVAIESDREFGLSVLERLDSELKSRADRFRDLGVQDLAGFRQELPDEPLPRILLVVDEFQELFVEDDKIAQTAALLLDRLVRQGRAFGIHLLLGSQTLGGAYSLARSTMGQIGVRIALRCSEVDAHLILSEDNTAARLLSRPGEAIYNDANGLVEGNHPFQVVWLSDDTREEYLKHVHELDQRANLAVPRPQVVFEGNIPAELEVNPLLDALLRGAATPDARDDFAWLGDAVAIKDPTAAQFRPQGGNNLLVVGQHDDAALGLMASSLVSLAAQHPASQPAPATGARFLILDGSPAGTPSEAAWQSLTALLPQGQVQLATWRELPAMISVLAAEVERRQQPGVADVDPIYLFIHGLQRFRDLRRQDDDFGFSRGGENRPPSPAKQMAGILREGSSVGVHTLIWCDSLNNVNRTFDRQGLREFEMRVVFQMSSNDSSTLIDTPIAGKLGMHRAIFFSEEQGRLEKFRPYALPAAGWLAKIASQLRLLAGST